MTDPTTREPDLSGETADHQVQSTSGERQPPEQPASEATSDPAPPD